MSNKGHVCVVDVIVFVGEENVNFFGQWIECAKMIQILLVQLEEVRTSSSGSGGGGSSTTSSTSNSRLIRISGGNDSGFACRQRNLVGVRADEPNHSAHEEQNSHVEKGTANCIIKGREEAITPVRYGSTPSLDEARHGPARRVSERRDLRQPPFPPQTSGATMASTPSSLSLSTAAVVAAASAIVTASLCLRRHASQLAKLEETRASERRGRIRAEMKLRSKHHDGASAALPHDLLLRCIGTVVSPYTKRMGTPRQGALVPSGRGYIQLRVPVDCVEGLERFSHAWVLFTFHANTDAPLGGIRSDGATDESRTMLQLTKTKIRPPRGGGVKVGMLATRSPHRPNNIGLSLVRLVKVDKKEKRLYIAAFDLVNGTPVYGAYGVTQMHPWLYFYLYLHSYISLFVVQHVVRRH